MKLLKKNETGKKSRKSDQNRYKKIYSIIHKILKSLKLSSILRNLSKKHRLDYFVCILIKLSEINEFEFFASLYREVITEGKNGLIEKQKLH